MRCPVCNFSETYVTKVAETIYDNNVLKKIWRFSRKCSYCDHEIEHWN